MPSTPTKTIDHEALRLKYRAERDKRLREDGNEQYIEPTGRFAHFLDDPYVERVEREPLRDEVTVAIIGGGFAGLVTGARLKEAGVDDVRIIEGGGDVGGAWYWNRYPGAMCDTAAMIYLPLLEETGHMPSQKYTQAPEIYGQAKRIATTFGLYDDALFSTEVTNLEWEATSSRWVIHTDRGDEIRARFVAMGTGPLHRPKLPGIPGIETFAGHSFHTSRWDYDYTGGSCEGDPLENLADKRVGIIGTGATGVQCIPQLAKDRRSSTSSSGRRRRSTCATTTRSTPRSSLVSVRLATEVADELRDPADRRIRRRGPGQGRLDRHRPAHSRPGDGRDGQAGAEFSPEMIKGVQRQRRREDEGDPGPGRRHRRGPGHRRGAQALVPPVVQAAVLPRRVPPGLQRARRPPRRHRRQGRRPHRRDRGVGRRRRTTSSTA